MATDLEDRLEELFMNDANARRVSSVGAPQQTPPWRGVLSFIAAAAVLAVVATAALVFLRGDAQPAAPSTTSTPTATTAPSTSPTVARGTVTGRLGYPSEVMPALAIYALPTSNTDDGRYMILTERTPATPGGNPTYRMEVPPGTYYLVAYSREAPPGVRFAGGYTRYVTCGMQPPCADHTLIPVTVVAGQTTANVDIHDWYLPPGETFPPEPRPSGGGALYESPLGYSIELPTGWRRSEAASRTTPFAPGQGDPDLLGTETFTRRTAQDEAEAIRQSDTGVGPALVYTANVSLYRNSRNFSATAYADREKGAYGLNVVSIEPVTVDGRSGAKTTFKFTTSDTKTFYALYVPDGDRMWVIRYFLALRGMDIPAGATEEDVRSIVESFRFRR